MRYLPIVLFVSACAGEDSSLQERLKILEDRVLRVERTPGPRGPVGSPGPIGPAGPQGPVGLTGPSPMPHLFGRGVDLGIFFAGESTITTVAGTPAILRHVAIDPVFFELSGCSGREYMMAGQIPAVDGLNASRFYINPIRQVVKPDFNTGATRYNSYLSRAGGCVSVNQQPLSGAVEVNRIGAQAEYYDPLELSIKIL